MDKRPALLRDGHLIPDEATNQMTINGIDGKNRMETTSNGHAFFWPFPFDKKQLVLVLGQQLDDMGYKNTVNALEAEANVKVRVELARNFCASLLTGDWDSVLKLLPLIMADHNGRKSLEYVYKERFLELMEAGSTCEAVALLRHSLEDLGDAHEFVQSLAMLLICTDKEELYSKSGWSGPSAGRKLLLEQLHELADPAVLPPINHLAHLLTVALQDRPEYRHGGRVSLFPLCSLKTEQLIFEPVDVIKTGAPVWHFTFSPHGTTYAYGLATGGIGLGQLLDPKGSSMVLLKHSKAVQKLSFSFTGKYLLSVGRDSLVLVWDVATGQVMRTLNHHRWPVLAGAWLGPEHVATCSEDGRVVISGLQDEARRDEVLTIRANDIVTHGERLYMATDSELYCFTRLTPELPLRNSWSTKTLCSSAEKITSISVSEDGAILSADTGSAIFMLRSDDGRLLNRVMSRPVHPNHVVRSCIAGNLLVRGHAQESENAKRNEGQTPIFVWQGSTGHWLAQLDGHTGPVNGVSWNDHLQVLASASDDCSIRIWKKGPV